MAADPQLEQLLADLRSLGRPDSSGCFTLDPERAGEMLERFRLPAPAYFMLHAVGAAVCSQATRVEIQVRSDLFALTFDGKAFPTEPDDGALWSSQRSPEALRLQELAVARGGALPWGAADFSLRLLPDGRQQLRVPKAGLLPKLLRPLAGWGRREEEDLLRQHLVPPPGCQLILNGSPLEQLAFPLEVQRATAIGAPNLLERVAPAEPARSLALAEIPWLEPDQLEALAGCQAFICELGHDLGSLARRQTHKELLRSYWPGYLDVVLNGRLYRCKLPPQFRRCWGSFWVNCLKRDLSRTFIAEDDLGLLHQFFARELLSAP